MEWFASKENQVVSTRQRIHSIITERNDLDRTLSTLLTQFATGNLNKKKHLRALTSMRRNLTAIDEHQRRVFDHECYDRSTKLAEEVFSIPELLEMILGHLPWIWLLKAMKVCRHFKTLIDSSAQLQRKLSLLPQSSPDFYELFPCYINGPLNSQVFRSVLRPRGDARCLAHLPEITIYVRMSRTPRTAGANCRRMLLTHPSAVELRPQATCCASRTKHPALDRNCTVRNKNGITVGDVLDAAARYAAGTENCPWASGGNHDLDGLVDAPIVFTGVVRLQSEDPFLQPTQGEVEQFWKKLARETVIPAFVQAKQWAFRRGEKVPTLLEYLETREDKDENEWIKNKLSQAKEK